MIEAIVFYTLALAIISLGIAVISTRSAVHSVLYLVLSFLLVAVLYVTLSAEFVAVIQVLVYAGGIVVLYLFVVMLVSSKRSPEQHADQRRLGFTGTLLAGAVLFELVFIAAYTAVRDEVSAMAPAVRDEVSAMAPAVPVQGNTEELGWLLYTQYLIPFEVASILLLVAMVGAIVLAKRG